MNAPDSSCNPPGKPCPTVPWQFHRASEPADATDPLAAELMQQLRQRLLGAVQRAGLPGRDEPLEKS